MSDEHLSYEPKFLDIKAVKNLNNLLAAQVICYRDDSDTRGVQTRAIFDNDQLKHTVQGGVRVQLDWLRKDSVETVTTKNGTWIRAFDWTVVTPQTTQGDAWGNPPLPVRQAGPDRSRPGSLQHQASATSTPYDSNGPPSGGNGPATIPIKGINPYISRFTLRARLVSLGEVRTWSNQKGEGKLQKVIFSDASGEIPACIFGQAIDKFEPVLQEGGIYTISKVKVKTQNERFKVTSHSCEMTIDENSEIAFVTGDDSSIPQVHVNFTKINAIEPMNKGDTVDVMGILIGATDMQSILIKSSGQQKAKRDLTIVDQSQHAINVCLWGNDATVVTDEQIEMAKAQYQQGSPPIVLLLKDAKVDEFQGKNLSKSFNSKMMVNPNIPEATELRNWYMNTYRGNEHSAVKLSGTGGGGTTPWMTIKELNDLPTDPVHQEGLDGKGVWFLLKASLKNVNLDGKFYWDACQTCGRKVTAESNDQFSLEETTKRCTNCNATVTSVKKWVCRVEVGDMTGMLKLTAMGDKANSIMRSSCDDAYRLSLTEDTMDEHGRNFEDLKFDAAGKEFHFKCVARNRVWQDQKQIDYQIADALEITEVMDGEREAHRLLKSLLDHVQ